MFAVIYIPDFALQAALRHEPELTRRGVGLVGPQNKAVVFQLTQAARQSGVCEGLTATQALARCPGIVIKPRSLAQEQAANQALLQCAYTFSPRIEATADGICTLDLTGLPVARAAKLDVRCSMLDVGCSPPSPNRNIQRPVPREWAQKIITALAQVNLRAQIGIAQTPNLALHAARCATPFLLVENPDDFIAGLPIESLDPPLDILDILHRWGIRTVGAFTTLGKDKIAERLGTEALDLFDRASARQTRPLRLVTPPEDFSEAMDFDMEIESLEPLLFVLRRFVEQLSNRLGALFLVVAELELRLTLSSEAHYERSFSIPAPTCEIDVLFRMLQTHLET